MPLEEVGPWLNIMMSSYQYRTSHCGDQTVIRSSYILLKCHLYLESWPWPFGLHFNISKSDINNSKFTLERTDLSDFYSGWVLCVSNGDFFLQIFFNVMQTRVSSFKELYARSRCQRYSQVITLTVSVGCSFFTLFLIPAPGTLFQIHREKNITRSLVHVIAKFPNLEINADHNDQENMLLRTA